LYLKDKLSDAGARIDVWNEFLSQNQLQHAIRMSHTDKDMLSLTFPIRFSNHVQLDKKAILETISPTLDLLQQKGLL
jgi:hypothetical protein